MNIKSLNLKQILVYTTIAVVFSGIGYGASRTTEAEVVACAQDPFVTAVFETVGYSAFFTKHELSEQLAKSGLGEADMKKYKEALEFAFDKAYDNPTYAALAQCLNK